jgi:hypothetical protein
MSRNINFFLRVLVPENKVWLMSSVDGWEQAMYSHCRHDLAVAQPQHLVDSTRISYGYNDLARILTNSG